MGVILNCGKQSLYVSLLNWENFKMYVLFLAFRVIGQVYPNIFSFVDERLELFERTINYEGMTNFERITNIETITNFKSITHLVSLQNIHKNQIVLFPSIFIEYVNANRNNIENMQLTGVHDLFTNTSVYDFNQCKNIFVALKILNAHMSLHELPYKDFNKINNMFENSWKTHLDLCVL